MSQGAAIEREIWTERSLKDKPGKCQVLYLEVFEGKRLYQYRLEAIWLESGSAGIFGGQQADHGPTKCFCGQQLSGLL